MVDSAATGVKKTAVSALVAAETISVLGTRMTYLALPVVRPRHDGIAREDELRPRSRDPADGDPRDPERRRRPAARIAHDDADRGRRARTDPRLDPPALRRRRAQLRPPARDRRAAGLLHAAVLRVAADDPARARRRGRDAHVAGEQRDRGRERLRRARRARPRRSADPVHRGVERPVRRRGDLPRRVRPRSGVRPATEAGRSRGATRRHGRACASSAATRSWRRWPRRSSSSGS